MDISEPSLLCIIPPKEFCQIRHLTLSCPNSDTLFSLPEVLGALDKPLLSLCFEVRVCVLTQIDNLRQS